MSIQLRVDKGDAYLHAKPHGTYARQEVFPTSRQVLDELRQHGLSRLLIDATDLDTDSISHSETQFIGQHIAQTFPATRDIKIAFIVSPDTQKELFDVIARQGETKLSVFSKKSDALDWLLG